MVQWVLKDNPETVLDPAFGLGVFYDEAIKIPSGNQVHFIGYEIDRNIFEFLNPKGDSPYLRVINSDYLEAETEKFDGIICNPPYMRFQKFLKRHDILPKIEEKIGKKLIGYSNISSVFLVKSLRELKINGNLAYIMPFEFFNTGYGKEIKKSLLENHLLKQIIIFANEKEIFPEATTTVCVLLCKNDGKKETIKILQIKKSDEIKKRHDAVDELVKKTMLSEELSSKLSEINDFDRILSRISISSSNTTGNAPLTKCVNLALFVANKSFLRSSFCVNFAYCAAYISLDCLFPKKSESADTSIGLIRVPSNLPDFPPAALAIAGSFDKSVPESREKLK
jgi:hypothetical protein